MFDIRLNDSGEIFLAGRFDASQVEKARPIFASVLETRIVDFKELEYISSAGLGILVETFKRLDKSGAKLKLRNLSPHITTIFRISGLDRVFEIVEVG